MKISATTSLNDAMSRLAQGNVGAGSVLALILKDRPDSAMSFFREMDKIGAYGVDIWWLYNQCGQELKILVRALSDGSAGRLMDKLRSSRGEA